MGVTAAAWLGAMATLAIPLAIHLWSRRRTTPQAIGSIRFLKSVKPVSQRTIRLRQPWRLVLRAALLTSLILALAGAYLDGAIIQPGPERWLIVSPTVNEGVAEPLIDSLSAEVDHVLLATGNVWSLLVSIDATLPSGSSIDVVAPTTSLRGTRPTITATTRWFPVAASSDGAGITPARRNFPHRNLAVLASSERWDDGRYLAAALEAIAAQDTDPGIVNLLDTGSLDGLNASWIAWLSADEPPKELLDHAAAGGVLVTDVTGDQGTAGSSIALPEPVALHRRGPAPPGIPIWRDGHGVSLLSAEPIGSGVHYRLATRLHPAWTGLVLRGSFPEALMPLLGIRPAPSGPPITLAQALPRQSGSLGGRTRTGTTRSLFLPLWLLASILFVFDAGISYRRRSASV